MANIPKGKGPVALAILPNGRVDTLPLSSKSFPLPAVQRSFPVKRVHSTGGAIQDGTAPLACGGTDAKGNRFDSCYKYSPKDRAWTESGWMSVGRSHHASSVHPDLGLVITGGYTSKGRTAAVEFTRDGKHFSKSLPAMPVAMHVHCQVTVDANTIMVFGGCPEDTCYSDVALKLNIAEKKWKKLPKMPTGRHAPSCGVVKENGVPKRVVVAGGHVPGSGPARISNKVEILELSTLTWKTGRQFTSTTIP